MLITPQYDYITSFNNGYAQAIRGGCCIVLDLSGKEYKAYGDSLVPLESKYDFVRDFKEGLACVKIDGKWGVINTSGNVLFHPSYDYITDFEYGIAKCIKEVQPRGYANHWCILNEDGESFDIDSEPKVEDDGIITFYRDELHEESGQIYATDPNEVRINKNGFYAPKNGDESIILTIPLEHYNIVRDFHCGLSCVNSNDGFWGVIDTKGRVIVPFEYQSIDDFKENRSFAKDKNGTIVLLSEEGRIIKKLEGITDNESFSNGVAIVYKETSDGHWRYLHGSCGLINSKGEFILDFFEGEIIATDVPNIFTLKSKASKGSKDKQEKVGYFNSASGLLVKPQYDEILRFETDYVVVKALDISECKISFNGKPFVFNDDERVMLPDWCIGGEDFQDGICKAQGANKKWGLVDKDGITICEPLYDSIGDVNGQYVTTMGSRVVEKRDSSSWSGTRKETVVTYGLVNLDDKVAISAKYDVAPIWTEHYYLVVIDGLYGVLDESGNVFIDPKYNKIEYLKKGYFKGAIKKGIQEKWYLIDESGLLSEDSYDEIVLDESGYFRFIINEEEGFLDMAGNRIARITNGDFVTVPSNYKLCSDFHNGYASVVINGCNNYVDEDFSIILVNNNKPVHIETPIDYVIRMDHSGNFIYRVDNKEGVLSKDGKVLIPPEELSILNDLSNCFYVIAKENLYKKGVIDSKGNLIIPCEYSSIEETGRSGFWLVSNGSCRGIIDSKGNLITPCEYSSIEGIDREGLWLVSKNIYDFDEGLKQKYYGIVSYSGETILNTKYEAIQLSSFGFFLKGSGKWMAFDESFTPIGDGAYDDFAIREDGYFTVSVIKKIWNSEVKTIGILSPSGNEKLAPIYHSIGVFNSEKFPEGLTVISKLGGPGNNGLLYGIINKDYDILLEPQFTSISEFKDGSCIAIKTVNGTPVRGSIDACGRYTDLSISTDVIPETESISKLENGLTIVKTREVEPFFSLIDSSGQVLLPFKYNRIEPLKNGQYRVLVKPSGYGYGYGGKYGILNNIFEEVIKPEYSCIEECGLYYIVSNNTYQKGIVDTHGKIIIPFKYQSIKKASDHLFWVYKTETNKKDSFMSSQADGLYGLADDGGNILIAPKYANVREFENGFACVMSGGLWGAVDSAGKEIIPLLYNSIEQDPLTSFFRISKSLYVRGEYLSKLVFGYVNTAGERVIKGMDDSYIISNPIYQWQEDYVDGSSFVYHSSGLTGQVNEQGQLILHYKIEGEIKEALLPSQFDWGYDSDTDRVVVEKDAKKGLYCITDECLLIEPKYNSITPLGINSNGSALYLVQNHNHHIWNEYGLIKETGEILLPPEYSEIEPLGFSLVVITSDDGKCHLYDTEYEKLFPEVFDHVFKFGERNDHDYWGDKTFIKDSTLAIVCSDDKYGAINRFGEIILPIKYPSLLLKEGDILVCNDMAFDSRGRNVVSNGTLTIPIKDCFKSATLLDNNLIVAKKDDNWGCVNLSMHEILPFIYESIDAHDRAFIVSRKNQDSDSLEYGVVDIQNNIIVPFSDVEEMVFDKGLFIFKKGNLYGAYSDKGILICDASYEKLECLNGFLIKVGRSDVEYDGGEDWYTERVVTRWGLINIAGEEVLPSDYKEIEEKGDSGFIQIKQYRYVGLLDATGKIVLEPKYYQIGDFVDSYSIVYGPISVYDKNRKIVEAKAYGVIDGALNEVIPCCFNSIEYEKETGMFKTERGYKLKDGRYLCSIGNKKLLVPSVYMYCREFYDDRAVTIKFNNPGFKYGMIDTSGKDVLPSIFDSLLHYNNGLYRFRLNDLFGIINREGSIILDNQYSGIGIFDDGLALITINQAVSNEHEDRKTFGLVNMSGEIILKPNYDLIGPKTNGYNVLLKHGQWSFFNSQTLKETLVNNVVFLGFCHDGRFLINVGGEFVPRRMKRPSGGSWGFVNENAEIVITPQYENANSFSEEKALVKSNGKWGAIDINGIVVIPFEYTDVYSNYENGQCRLMSGSTIHVFDSDGKEIKTYPCPRSHYDDDYDYGYSQADLDDMYRAAFEGDPSAQWNID